MWRLIISKLCRRRGGYNKLCAEYDFESSDSCIMTTSTTIDSQRNKASHADVVAFWQNAVQPTFRSRRGGIDEIQLKKDFMYLEMMIYEEGMREYNLI